MFPLAMKDAYDTKNGSSESTEFLLEDLIDKGYNSESDKTVAGVNMPISIIMICMISKPWKNKIDDTITAIPIVVERINRRDTLAAYI
jgi:hypothetical protein